MGSVDQVPIFAQRLPGTDATQWNAWTSKFRAHLAIASLPTTDTAALAETVVQLKAQLKERDARIAELEGNGVKLASTPPSPMQAAPVEPKEPEAPQEETA